MTNGTKGMVHTVDSQRNSGRRPSRSFRWVALAVLGLSGVLASCSNSSSPNESGASAVTPQDVSVWFERIADVMHPCDSASRETSASLEVFAARSDGIDHDLTVVLDAGNGVEQCSLSSGVGLTPDQIADVPTGMKPLVDVSARWMTSMESANLAILIATADNLDNRVIVGEAFDKQADANAVADEFDAVLAQLMGEVGLTLPEDVQLHRWKVDVQ